MIQEIAPHEFHNEYRPGKPEDGDPVFVFSGRQILLDEEKEHFPRVRDLPEEDRIHLRYLFDMDGRKAFLCFREDGSIPEIPGFSFSPIRTLRRDGKDPVGFYGSTAWHLSVWYNNNRFCGRCGKKMVPGTRERSMVCSACGNVVYPTIAPAVIIGITDGDRIVMTRYKGREYKGIALVAGFCEIGEEAEDTVRREAMEETGLSVGNIRYVTSQPWGFDENLLFGYFCDVTGSRKITREEDELSEAVWVARSDIPPQENTMSLTATMIELFRQGKEKVQEQKA